jgi:hypothetical protein
MTAAPPTLTEWDESMAEPDMVLELADGLALSGNSFGATGKSVAGECVFQTGEFLATYAVPCVVVSLSLTTLSSSAQVWSDTPSLSPTHRTRPKSSS